MVRAQSCGCGGPVAWARVWVRGFGSGRVVTGVGFRLRAAVLWFGAIHLRLRYQLSVSVCSSVRRAAVCACVADQSARLRKSKGMGQG